LATEGHIDVPGGSVWYRSIGEGPGTPLLVVHGGPGFCHDYLTALDDLADRRQVIYWDQLGCGRSERPDDESLWTVERHVQEVDAVRSALGLERHHMFGNSWGGMLGMQYAIDRRPPLVSLTISNSPASIPRFIQETAALKAKLPEDVQRTIDWHEERGFYACPEYQGAIAVWFQTHICRMQPWPEGLERSFSGVGVGPYMTMVGPSDFNVTGNLLEWDILGRLSEIEVPTLFLAGRYDEILPDHVRAEHEQVAGSEFILFEDSAHLPFEEERERCMAALNDFFERCEAKAQGS
jgi:proline-specific peptidase